MRAESESDKWRDLECGDKELCTGVSIKTRNEEYFIMTSITTRRGAMTGFFNQSRKRGVKHEIPLQRLGRLGRRREERRE